jgi:hypothetical protein
MFNITIQGEIRSLVTYHFSLSIMESIHTYVHISFEVNSLISFPSFRLEYSSSKARKEKYLYDDIHSLK